MTTPGFTLTIRGQSTGSAPRQQLNIVTGSRAPLKFNVQDGKGNLYDLNGATVTLRMRARDAAAGSYKINAACAVDASGLATYTLAAADADAPGEYYADLRIVLSGGGILTTEIFTVRIRDAL